MQLPHTDDVAEIAAELGIDPSAVPLLERVSRRAIGRATKAEIAPSTPLAPLGQLEEQELQVAEGIWFHAGYVPPVCEWPWRSVQALAGAILPGEVWVVPAQSGNGKSQWVANLVARLARRGTPRLTVAPLERKARELRGLWACLELGYDPAKAFKGEWLHLPDGAREKLLAHMSAQLDDRRWASVAFTPEASLDRRDFERVVRRAHEWHHRLVVIDHLHHMDHGDGPENRAIRETMKLAKRLAQELDLAILFTAQLNRGQKTDSYQRFYPPEMTDVQGSSAIEQIADGVLLLYRPLREGVKKADLDAVRMGQAKRDTVFQANTMAVRCGKHRLDGTKTGEDALLFIRAGVISDRVVLGHGVVGPATDWAGVASTSTKGDAYEPGNGYQN